jgi:hypothetical protein
MNRSAAINPHRTGIVARATRVINAFWSADLSDRVKHSAKRACALELVIMEKSLAFSHRPNANMSQSAFVVAGNVPTTAAILVLLWTTPRRAL